MNVYEWTTAHLPLLNALEVRSRIPARFASAQMAHEAWNADGGLSGLAERGHNFAGLKFAEWQRAYGAQPVIMGTWEYAPANRVQDAFAAFPDFAHFLQCYEALLTSEFYAPALAYAQDPLLYGLKVWQFGWATDPQYLPRIADWMVRLWETVRPRTAVISVNGQPVVQGVIPADGRLRAVDPVFDLLVALGYEKGRNAIWTAEPPGLDLRLGA